MTTEIKAADVGRMWGHLDAYTRGDGPPKLVRITTYLYDQAGRCVGGGVQTTISGGGETVSLSLMNYVEAEYRA